MCISSANGFTNIDEKHSTSANNRSLFLCILLARDLILIGGSREGYEEGTDGGLQRKGIKP